jgi:hypothetical protein
MGFKTIPWTLYVKSDGTFVIRQRHTHHTSANVDAINKQVKKAADEGKAPATRAHYDGIAEGAARPVIRYASGKRVKTLAVELPYFRRALGKAMLDTIKPVVTEYEDQTKTEKSKGEKLPEKVREPVSYIKPETA